MLLVDGENLCVGVSRVIMTFLRNESGESGGIRVRNGGYIFAICTAGPNFFLVSLCIMLSISHGGEEEDVKVYEVSSRSALVPSWKKTTSAKDKRKERLKEAKESAEGVQVLQDFELPTVSSKVKCTKVRWLGMGGGRTGRQGM